MDKKHHVIIGGANGLIGQELFTSFKKLGYQVYGLDLSFDKHAEDNSHLFEVDLTHEEEVKKAFSQVFSKINSNQVSLINCQAIANPDSGEMSDLSLEKWMNYLNVNLTSYFLTCKHFLKYKKQISQGVIVNISSTRHLMAEPNTEAYCATKGGINSFTKALAISLSGSGIRVNSISPGWISDGHGLKKSDHSQHPAGRVGTPQDIFNMSNYLLSSNAGFITGQDFIIDGGMTSKMIYQD